jgi:hypothetical protein
MNVTRVVRSRISYIGCDEMDTYLQQGQHMQNLVGEVTLKTDEEIWDRMCVVVS